MSDDGLTERNCLQCGGEGRHLSGHPNDPHPIDNGPCRACDGTGRMPFLDYIEELSQGPLTSTCDAMDEILEALPLLIASARKWIEHEKDHKNDGR